MVQRILPLQDVLQKHRSAFLFGPRGVGKTWLCLDFLAGQDPVLKTDILRHAFYRRYVTQPDTFRLEVEAALRPGKVLTVFVDEIQRIPALLDEVHSLIETHKNAVRFLLTGSSARKLKRHGANLLAGRAALLHLHPLTHREGEANLDKILRHGSLPAVHQDPSGAELFLQSYVDVYLKEEIQQEALVRRYENFVRFLDVAAQMNGEPFNFSSIARDAGVDPKTAREYASILVDTLVAFRLEGWTWSVRKQLRHSPKFYFFDCGVLNALRGDLSTPVAPGTFAYGKLFETYLMQELWRLNDYLRRGFRFFYWRTNSGLEVDAVLARGPHAAPVAIEIKSSEKPTVSDLRSLLSFQKENPSAHLYCLCQTPRAYRMEGVDLLPWREGIRKIMEPPE